MGLEALKKHNLLQHPNAGRQCYTCLMGGGTAWARAGNAASVVAKRKRREEKAEALIREAEAILSPPQEKVSEDVGVVVDLDSRPEPEPVAEKPEEDLELMLAAYGKRRLRRQVAGHW